MIKYLLSLVMVFSAVSISDAAQVNGSQATTSAVRHWDDSNFDAAIAKGIVVVDFHAVWCPPCQKFGPTFAQVAAELGGDVQFGKVNVDKGKNVAAKYRVSSIPTTIIFKDGKELKRKTGGMDEDGFRIWVESIL